MDSRPVLVWVRRDREKVQRWLVEDFGDTLIVEDAQGRTEQVFRSECEMEPKRQVILG